MAKVLVLRCSSCGHIEAMAKAVAGGRARRWGAGLASVDELEGCHAIKLFG